MGEGGSSVDDLCRYSVEKHIFFVALGFLEGHDSLKCMTKRLCDRVQRCMQIRHPLMQAAHTPADGGQAVLEAGGHRGLVAVGNMPVQVSDVRP
ncbi:hypothetical protein D3C73_1272600 [compost metagenome]